MLANCGAADNVLLARGYMPPVIVVVTLRESKALRR
jgi:hypothetical protein